MKILLLGNSQTKSVKANSPKMKENLAMKCEFFVVVVLVFVSCLFKGCF